MNVVHDAREVEERMVTLAHRARTKHVMPADQIARGAHRCWSNALSLLSDVRLLVTHDRYARALSLTILALEELAKPPLLWSVTPEDDSKVWEKFWSKQFAWHGVKQEKIGAYGDVTGLARSIYWFKLNSEAIKSLDTLKQWGFYVDCVDGQFQSPDDFGSQEHAITDLLFAFVEERADSFGLFHASPGMSLYAYENRSKASRPGELWPPPVKSSAELQGVLLSLASECSYPATMLRDKFLDGCGDLRSAAGKQLFHDGLWATGRVCCRRARCVALPTAHNRAIYMLNMCLEVVPKSEQRDALREWDQDSTLH